MLRYPTWRGKPTVEKDMFGWAHLSVICNHQWMSKYSQHQIIEVLNTSYSVDGDTPRFELVDEWARALYRSSYPINPTACGKSAMNSAQLSPRGFCVYYDDERNKAQKPYKTANARRPFAPALTRGCGGGQHEVRSQMALGACAGQMSSSDIFHILHPPRSRSLPLVRAGSIG